MENLERMASVSCKNEEAVELHGIVCKLREAIAKFIGDFMNSLQQGDKRATKNFRGSHLHIYMKVKLVQQRQIKLCLAVGVTLGLMILFLDGGSLLGLALRGLF